VSYTWAHSIDDLSNGQPYDTAVLPYQSYVDPRAWGSSDFDIRQSLNGSIIAALPSPHNGIAAVLFRNWTANSIFFARSALPADLYIGSPYIRPNLVPGEPLYLYGPEYPGGKSFNLAAFAAPPGALTTAEVQGDLGRNVLRGLCAWQIAFALHREFPLREGVSLQFRAEAFNLLNHPNFANPSDSDNPGVLTVAPGPQWGAATQTLANGLSPSGVVGQLSPLFQIGGPRGPCKSPSGFTSEERSCKLFACTARLSRFWLLVRKEQPCNSPPRRSTCSNIRTSPTPASLAILRI
jgi:hypothetical protein